MVELPKHLYCSVYAFFLFVLQYIEGGALINFIDETGHSLTMDAWLTYLNITLDIARGMHYLHTQGVIHRDLNSNVCYLFFLLVLFKI